ncbi:MAG: GntR family transcriptional regulator [Lachnospiraceae bacterium]|nr:GntR family transcriptional regulator [Lachnospiraceae bacterium]
MDYKFNVNVNEYLPLREVVFNNLRDAILNGELKPGERLLENQLADKLGISRTPVREALRMLEQENLVALFPRKGAQVLDLSATDIKNVLEIRSALEAVAMRHACQSMDVENLNEIKRLNVEFERAFEEKEYEKVATTDEKIHDIIFAAAHNDRLVQIISNMRAQVYRYRMAYLKVYETKTAVINHHRGIIRSIENHLEEEGIKVMSEHIDHQIQVILKSLK